MNNILTTFGLPNISLKCTASTGYQVLYSLGYKARQFIANSFVYIYLYLLYINLLPCPITFQGYFKFSLFPCKAFNGYTNDACFLMLIFVFYSY